MPNVNSDDRRLILRCASYCSGGNGWLIVLLIVLTPLVGRVVSADAPLYACNKTIDYVYISSKTPMQGFIVSTHYSRPYPSGQYCTFSLEAPPNSGLVLHFAFIDLDLEERFSKSSQCLRDYIRFMMTDREGREHIGPRICGSEKLPALIRGMQSKAEILFVSSFAVIRRRGFKIRFDFVPEAQIGAPPSIYKDKNTRWQSDCGGTVDVSAPSAEIRSPGFPMTYPRDVTCNWLIRVEPHERIYVRLIHLELSPTVAECDRASLTIIDGYNYGLNSDTLPRKFSDSAGDGPAVKYCGGHLYYNEEGLKSYLSTSNRVVIRRDQPTPEQFANYRSDGTPIGFRLLWTKVVNSVIVDTMEIDSINGDESTVGDSIRHNTQEYESECKGGFLCKGGEFCIDDEHSICAQRSRLCINATLQCDGVANCAENDDSDEYHCYSQDTVVLVCIASFVIFLFSTLFLMAMRSLARCGVHRQRLKNTREYYATKVGCTGGVGDDSSSSSNNNSSSDNVGAESSERPQSPKSGIEVLPESSKMTSQVTKPTGSTMASPAKLKAQKSPTVATVVDTPKSSFKHRMTNATTPENVNKKFIFPTVEIASEPFYLSAEHNRDFTVHGTVAEILSTYDKTSDEKLEKMTSKKETSADVKLPLSGYRAMIQSGNVQRRTTETIDEKKDDDLPECNCDSAISRALVEETMLSVAERLFNDDVMNFKRYDATTAMPGNRETVTAPTPPQRRFYGLVGELTLKDVEINELKQQTKSDNADQLYGNNNLKMTANDIRYCRWTEPTDRTDMTIAPETSNTDDAESPIWQLGSHKLLRKQNDDVHLKIRNEEEQHSQRFKEQKQNFHRQVERCTWDQSKNNYCRQHSDISYYYYCDNDNKSSDTNMVPHSPPSHQRFHSCDRNVLISFVDLCAQSDEVTGAYLENPQDAVATIVANEPESSVGDDQPIVIQRALV